MYISLAHLYFNEDYPEALTEFKRLANADKTFYKLSAISDDIVANDYPVSRDLYNKYTGNLRRAVDAVFSGDDADTDLALRLKAGVTRFGAFKAFNATQDIRAKGRTGAATASDDAENVEKRYNSFQAAEYATAASRARTAKQFAEYMTADRMRLFPNLRWLPSRSVEVRPEHRIFWNRVWPKTSDFWQKNQPGNLWNCKCDMEETDDPTDIPEKLNPKYSSASPGLKGNPAVTGKIFSDDCSYIQRVKDPVLFKQVEKSGNYLLQEKYLNDTSLQTQLTSLSCTCKCKNETIIDVYLEKYGYEECFGKMLTADSETFYLKNEVVKRWPQYLAKSKYLDFAENDMAHNTGKNKRNRFKRHFDYFYYYETTMADGQTIYLHIGHNTRDGKYYLWTITAEKPKFINKNGN